MFVLVHFQGHNFCHTQPARPQLTFKDQSSPDDFHATKTYVQGDPLKSTPPKFSKYKISSKLAQNFSECQKL